MTWRRVAAWAVLVGVVAAMAGGFALLGSGDADCSPDAPDSDSAPDVLAADGCPTGVEWTLATGGVLLTVAGVVLGLVVVE